MSTALPTLPTLPSLDEASSSSLTADASGQTPSTLGSTSWSSAILGALEQGAGINNAGTLETAVGVPGGGSTTMNIVFIILGIVLIGIGALSFRTTQNIIETGGKVAATVAA